MSRQKIKYREGYKYQLAETYTVETGITQISRIATEFISLDENGLLTIDHGYAWDGPSGPAMDTPSTMRGSLGHDGLYQLMRMGLLDQKWRSAADELYHRWCIEDGMWPIRAWWHFEGVDLFAAGAAKINARKQIITAPAIAALLFLSACGTTFEGERRAQSAGGTFINLETSVVLEDGRIIPIKLAWDTGSAKDRVKVTFWHPETEAKIFEYEARAVTQPEQVMALLASVKGEIAKAQIELGADALDAVARGIVSAITGY